VGMPITNPPPLPRRLEHRADGAGLRPRRVVILFEMNNSLWQRVGLIRPQMPAPQSECHHIGCRGSVRPDGVSPVDCVGSIGQTNHTPANEKSVPQQNAAEIPTKRNGIKQEKATREIIASP